MHSDDHVKIVFEDKQFCFTGKCDYGTKKECAEAVSERGGKTKRDVSGKIDYLVVGNRGNERWSNGSEGGKKIEKARSLGIPIISEDQWVEALEKMDAAA